MINHFLTEQADRLDVFRGSHNIKPVRKLSVSEQVTLKCDVHASCYLCDLELVDLFDNEVIE